MLNHFSLLAASLGVCLLLGCAEDQQADADCERCPDGFSCMVTAFGTFDCVPDSTGAQRDGGTSGHDAVVGGDATSNFRGDARFITDLALVDQGVMSMAGDQELPPSLDEGLLSDVQMSPDAMDTPPTSERVGPQPGSRIVRLDVPSSATNARLAGCQVVGRNAGSGLSGVFAILQTNITDQLQVNSRGNIPLVLLSRFLDWPVGLTAAQHGSGPLEFYLGYQADENAFAINETSFVENTSPPVSRIRFDSEFSGSRFRTSSGVFMIETASFSLPFFVELDLAWLDGQVEVTDDGVSMTQTTLNGYLTFSSVRRVVMGIQTYCNQAGDDSFCSAANRFLDGDPTTPELDGDTAQIARDVILPLMRNLDVRIDGDQALECDAFCDGGGCVECNAVSVCAIVESEPVEIR